MDIFKVEIELTGRDKEEIARILNIDREFRCASFGEKLIATVEHVPGWMERYQMMLYEKISPTRFVIVGASDTADSFESFWEIDFDGNRYIWDLENRSL